MTRARVAAIVALVLGAAAIGFAIYAAIEGFPGSLIVVVLLAIAAGAGTYALLHRGAPRALAAAVAVAAIGATVLVVILDGRGLEAAVLAAMLLGTLAASKAAYAVRTPLPARPRLSARSSSTTRSPEGARRPRSTSPTRLVRAASRRSS